MKILTKSGLLALSAALTIPSAYAQATPNADDLVLGFNGFTSTVAGGGPNPVAADSLYDLGNMGTILTAGPNFDLTSMLSGSFIPNYSSSLNVGAVAGSSTGTINAFMTTVRGGGGSYTTAGTETAPQAVNGQTLTGDKNALAPAAALIGGLSLGMNPYPSSTTPGTANTSGNSWSQTISAGPAQAGSGPSSFVGSIYGSTASQANESPMGNFGGSETIVEDVWGITAASSGKGPFSWTYEGDLTITENPGGMTNSATVIWDMAPTPEPGTFGLLTAGGLLLLAVRNRYKNKNA
jgi:hypothetical protein